MPSERIPVLKMGNGFYKASLKDGKKIVFVFGRDLPELIGRLRAKPVRRLLPVASKDVGQFLDIRG